MATRPPLDEALRNYLRKLGQRGGKAAAGRGGREYWSDIPAAERSRMMSERAKKRWAKARKAKKKGS